MKRSKLRATRLVWSLAALAAVVPSAKAKDLYAPPKAADVRTQAVQWVAEQKITDKVVLKQVGQLWVLDKQAAPSARLLLGKLIETFRLADSDTRRFLDRCSLTDLPTTPPDATFLSRKGAEKFYTANMQLFYARYLAQRGMYDEALAIFEKLDPKTVVDPATCLFYRAVCEHELLRKTEGLATINKLLKDTEDVPVSYSTVATLMQYDLQGARPKSLDEVARKMKDSHRRLDLGRGGRKVQKVQKEIIATLDEIIKRLEEQSGGGGGGGSGPPKGNRSSSPANDSQVGGATAPGNVDKKHLANKAGWGALPPKAQARAKNHLNKKFPAYYRRVVEAYNRKLAERPVRRQR